MTKEKYYTIEVEVTCHCVLQLSAKDMDDLDDQLDQHFAKGEDMPMFANPTIMSYDVKDIALA